MNAEEAYTKWTEDPTPERMADVLDSLAPTINSEVQRYNGPKPLLRSKARGLAITAVKKYNPDSGAKLRSWTVTQLQPLSRYGKQLKPVRSGEIAVRQASEIAARQRDFELEHGRTPTDLELADTIGISPERVSKLRTTVNSVMNESQLADADTDNIELPAVSQSSTLDFTSEAVYNSLSKRDQMIFDWKTGKHNKPALSNQEIAARLGMTPAAVSQITGNIANSIKSVV